MRVLTFVLLLGGALWPDALAQAQVPAAQTPPSWFVRHTTRVESWRFFEPRPGGGDPTSVFVGSRTQIGLRRVTPRVEVLAAAQFVQLGWLPERATSGGPLGLGAVYFDHAGTRHPRELSLKYLNVRFKQLAPGLSLQVGRFGYASGAESPSGVAKIEAVKRLRVDARLVGEFEFSYFQRSFDGARVDFARPAARVTAAAFFPTQGGFEEDASRTISDIRVLTGALSLPPGRPLPRTDWQVFALRYDDDRRVTARPDNVQGPAVRADVHVTTVGTTLASAAPLTHGELDTLIWVAAQTGDWYGLDHRAWAGSFELGFQWTQTAARPGVRGGWLRASGDANGADARHGTFFQMLPTVRRHAQSATYNQMNLRDLFVQTLVTPARRVSLRAEVHRLDLDRAADRWYFGSGATQREGRVFGFSSRPSVGATRLGTVAETGLEISLPHRWTLGGYIGRIAGGEVVRRQFAGDRLTFAFLELVKLVN